MPINRRTFLAGAGALPLTSSASFAGPTSSGRRPVCIASGNGLGAVARAMEHMRAGGDPTEAVVEGVALVEADENDTSVGYGGLPNEDGVVQLDASVMHGPTHKAGAVACIENIKHPARVALEVLRGTDHVMLVGDGARRFAVMHGFPEENLLTERARKAWVRWKNNLSDKDDRLNPDQRTGPRELDPQQAMAESLGVPFHYGTIHCAAVDANGDVGACTTTSGLSWKIPGRVGDSPVIGAGMFVDNNVGAAGATGRGESLIQSCGSFQIVRHMEDGMEPEEACLRVLKWIADHTKRPDLLNAKGEPNFGATVYAVRKDGVFGSASLRGRHNFAVHDGTEARHVRGAALYE